MSTLVIDSTLTFFYITPQGLTFNMAEILPCR